MASLAIHRDFLAQYAQLDKPVRARVAEVFGKFGEATHAGLHLEKIERARDPRMRTIRITRSWRGVVLAPEAGDAYLLLRVMPHDDAIAWARRHEAGVNTASGAVEVWDAGTVEQLTPGLEAAAETAERRLFDGVSNANLRRLGIDEKVLPLVRLLTDEGHLDALQSLLPEQQYDVLAGLAAGMSVEEVWREITADEPVGEVDPGDMRAAMARAQGRVVLVSGPEELMEVLRYPFALWRVFLHPTQKRVASRHYSGPARVTGGAGTGKTVVALHRAAHLAEQPGTPDRSILLTTFTRTLADELRRNLGLLLDEELLAKVDIVHVDRLANQTVTAALGGHFGIINERDEKVRWGRVLRRLELPFTESFLMNEWRHVVLAQDLRTREAYLAAVRAGRGVRLGRSQREQVWHAVEAFTDGLRRDGRWTYLQVCAESARLLADRGEPPYRHVVVDEAQDLHPAQWRTLRAAAAPGPDDLFIAGDTHQRIYDNRVSLRRLGISVAGRSSRLRINYRTTAEILRWGLGILTGEPVDDMDGGDESLSGYRSAMHGRRPALYPARDKDDELDRLVDQVREWADAGVEANSVGVAARTPRRRCPVRPAQCRPARLWYGGQCPGGRRRTRRHHAPDEGPGVPLRGGDRGT